MISVADSYYIRTGSCIVVYSRLKTSVQITFCKVHSLRTDYVPMMQVSLKGYLGYTFYTIISMKSLFSVCLPCEKRVMGDIGLLCHCHTGGID